MKKHSTKTISSEQQDKIRKFFQSTVRTPVEIVKLNDRSSSYDLELDARFQRQLSFIRKKREQKQQLISHRRIKKIPRIHRKVTGSLFKHKNDVLHLAAVIAFAGEKKRKSYFTDEIVFENPSKRKRIAV